MVSKEVLSPSSRKKSVSRVKTQAAGAYKRWYPGVTSQKKRIMLSAAGYENMFRRDHAPNVVTMFTELFGILLTEFML